MQHIVTLLIAILIFGLIIGIHEFGHFIVAKLNHIQVNEFAIGMGPKLLHFRKGETTYSLRLFPIGGVCSRSSPAKIPTHSKKRQSGAECWWYLPERL